MSETPSGPIGPGFSLHKWDTFMGRRQLSKNVLLFYGASGREHGYVDGWKDLNHFDYCGEGQEGDQVMARGNLQILNHRRDGRALRLFKGTSDHVEYLGEFELDANGYSVQIRNDRRELPRKVFIFHLVLRG